MSCHYKCCNYNVKYNSYQPVMRILCHHSDISMMLYSCVIDDYVFFVFSETLTLTFAGVILDNVHNVL